MRPAAILIAAALCVTAPGSGATAPVLQRGETLPDIDISGSPNGIVPLPESVPPVFRDVFVRYTKVVAPNGKPINILAQDGWSEARMIKARNVLEHILNDVPGTLYGSDKSVVANTMADNRATLTLFNTEPDMREAFRGPLGRVDLGMQDLRANECPVEGHEDYMAHRTRDASFEEVLHMVHDYGIKPALPEMQLDLIRITDAAIEGGLWEGRQDDRENEPNEYFAAIYDNYLDLWTTPPTVYEGRPIEAGRIPEGTSHFGIYRARGRDGLRRRDPEGLAILQEFFPPYLTYTPELPPDFTGVFSLEPDPALRYTIKSQHLKDVTLTGSSDAGLTGNGWDNVFMGNEGDNTLRGNGGDDLLDGGAGTDSAVYAGNEREYAVVREGGVVRVVDRRGSRDGTDVLVGVERLIFADGAVDLEGVFAELSLERAQVLLDGEYGPPAGLPRLLSVEQRQTRTDMLRIGAANAAMRGDLGRYAESINELNVLGFLDPAAPHDGWGNAFVYVTGTNTYTLSSMGCDGAAGPRAPAVWVNEPCEPDLMMLDGQFIQLPTGQ